jgi:hypothetical protein
MHTKTVTIDGVKYVVHYNSDWSGDAYIKFSRMVPCAETLEGFIRRPTEVTLPGELLVSLARDSILEEVTFVADVAEYLTKHPPKQG